MSTLRLRGDLPERVDLLNITPLALSGLSEAEAGKLAIGTSRRGLTLGDVFEIRLDGSDSLVIEGGSSRLDRVGAALSEGSIRVEGDAGQRLGEGMAGGALGDHPGYGMRRGTLIAGSHGALLPTFVETGTPDLVFTRLLAQSLKRLGVPQAGLLGGTLRRYSGDLATLGKGEMFVPA